MTDLLWTHAPDPIATLVLAHGAGAAMDSAFMTRIAEALAAAGIAVVRFEFPYMAERRVTGRKRPPPAADTLVGAYRRAVEAVAAAPDAAGPLLIGGKSMGGRVAVMAAGGALDARVAGVVCLGYPFHPPGQGEAPRLPPLAAVRLPVLILQGERDEFGDRAEVEAYDLSTLISVVFVEDGSHDFGPRGASPATLKGNILFAAGEIAAFARRLAATASAPEETAAGTAPS